MAKTVTIEVSEGTYETLRDRAAREGLSVEEWIEREAESDGQISASELLQRLGRLPAVDLGGLTGADLVRETREDRTDQLLDAIRRR